MQAQWNAALCFAHQKTSATRRADPLRCSWRCFWCAERAAHHFVFPVSKQTGIRKQETEMRNVKVTAHWSWRGRRRLDVYRSKAQFLFTIGSQNEKKRKITVDRTQAGEHQPPPPPPPTWRGCILMLLWIWSGEMEECREGKQNWDAAPSRLNHAERNQATERMRGSPQCVWAQYWYWAEALELK